jgi:hypothetical protein
MNPGPFQYEFVFEWGIPDDHVLHKVSLETLMDRGLRVDPEDWSTRQLRASMAREFEQSTHHGPFDIGINLGYFSQTFGARAPLEWIAYQWYYDCVRRGFESSYVAKLRYAHGRTETVWIGFFSDLNSGVEIVLMDWWLTDSDFADDYKKYKAWKRAMEVDMRCYLLDFLKTWDGEEDDCIPWELLWAKNRDIEEEIEAEAVRIGL